MLKEGSLGIVLLQACFIILLFMLAFVAVRMLLHASVRRTSTRNRLAYVHKQTIGSKLTRSMARYSKLYQHLSDLLESLRFRLSLGALLYLTVVLGLGGAIG